jgi:hypothetical protein
MRLAPGARLIVVAESARSGRFFEESQPPPIVKNRVVSS